LTGTSHRCYCSCCCCCVAVRLLCMFSIVGCICVHGMCVHIVQSLLLGRHRDSEHSLQCKAAFCGECGHVCQSAWARTCMCGKCCVLSNTPLLPPPDDTTLDTSGRGVLANSQLQRSIRHCTRTERALRGVRPFALWCHPLCLWRHSRTHLVGAGTH